jgi:polysaccharide biosynthesis/export protein
MRYIYFVFALLLLFTSCVSQRKAVYVQPSKDHLGNNNSWSGNKKSIKIDAFDMLYIKVATIDQPEYNFFNEENKNLISEASLSVTSYIVDELGFVILPVVGKVKLKDLTLEEASLAVKTALKDVLSTPIVSVRFINNSITVLGEVVHAGTYNYSTEQINVFRAIGLAGDISEYGDKKNAVLIRERGKEIQKYRLDLTSEDIFRSEFYYLRPNDVLYIPPMKIRRFGMREIPFALILTFVNTLVVTLVYAKILK